MIYKNLLLSAEMFLNDFYKIKLDDEDDVIDKRKRRANRNGKQTNVYDDLGFEM